MRRALATAGISLLIAAAAAAAVPVVPYLTGRVTDNAEILSSGTSRSLSDRLKAHEELTGNQVAVLTVPSLEGESIEEFAVRVFEAWKLGARGRDNGVLVVVAPAERRMRIEVGFGLEGVLTDLQAGRIIRTIMTPRFKDGDYNGGIEAGVQAMLTVLEKKGEPGEGAGSGSEGREESAFSGPDLPVTERILFGAFIFGIIGLFTVIGVVTPGAGWFLYIFLIPFWAMFPIIVVGTRGALVLLAIYLIAFPAAKLAVGRRRWYQKAKEDLRTKGSASIGGFVLRSGGGGGGWSSGGSGGFSGGGGSSGGGGASGSW